MSTRTLLDSTAIQAVLQHHLWDVALRRQQAVQEGHETAELAGVLVQHFGSGMVEAVRALLGPDGDLVAGPLLVAVDHTAAHLDPAWQDHGFQRWAARPARLVYD